MSAGPQIVVWANEDLLPWQRDGVRCLLTSHKLTDEDRKELLTMAKVAGEKIWDGDLVLVRPGTAGRLRPRTYVAFASATEQSLSAESVWPLTVLETLFYLVR